VSFFDQFFSLFRKKPDSVEDQVDERRLQPRINPREGTRILVIDDSATILAAMKRFLESAHCVFLGALDAKMGMEVALTQKPELIFLDIVMPGINGFAALRALRKNARTRDTPIIMMSGNEQAKALFFGAHIGADDFMRKPFSRFEVFGRIARLLDEERAPRRPAQPGGVVREEQAVQPVAPEQANEIKAIPAMPQAAPVNVPPAAREAPVAPQREPVAAAPAQPLRVAIETPTPPPPRPEPAQESPTPLLSARVVSIAPPPEPVAPAVAPELLSRIARLAMLAQSDPEALKALAVLASQLVAQVSAAAARDTHEEEVMLTRATAT
jgi:twitching motility two-component system response regulator PilH